MKEFAFAPILLLAACAEGDVAEPAVEEEAAAETAGVAFDGMPLAGTYQAVSNSGETLIQVLNEDGTIATTNEAGETVDGTWTSEGPDNFCWTDNTEGSQANCFTMEAGDGEGWLARNNADADEVWTVTRQE